MCGLQSNYDKHHITRDRNNTTYILYCYTLDVLCHIGLVKSIQSIYNSLWTWHGKCNIPLEVFSSGTEWMNASPLFLRLGCIIKQLLLNSVFTWYNELSKPRVRIICRSRRLREITQTLVLIIHDVMLNLIQ